MKKRDLIEDPSRSVPWRFYIAAFLFMAALAWLFPITPSGDGPFQTLNWISRIKQGQLPGRDFDVFHGVGVLWFHAVLALPFDSVREVVWVHYLGSILAQWILWTCILGSRGIPVRRAASEGAALCGLMQLTMGFPLANVSVLVSAGNSMVGARVALPLTCLFLAHKLIRSSDNYLWLKAGILMGAAAGAGCWFSTDQALASIVMGIMTAAAFAGSNLGGSVLLRISHAALAFSVALTAALVTYVLLLWMITGIGLNQCLEYWWKVLPQVQFWYFGGAPNAYFHTFRDLLVPDIIILMFASLCLHLVGFVFRSQGQLPLRLGLVSYGFVSLVPLLGILSSHYISGLWCSGLVSLLVARWPNRASSYVLSLVPERKLFIIMSSVCLLLSARAVQVQLKHESRCPFPEKLPPRLFAANDDRSHLDAVPNFVKAEFDSRSSPNLLRAFYRSEPEISLGQGGVGRFDYIIHALGDNQQLEYQRVLQSNPPLFVRVPSQKSFRYAQWLWHQWPDLWSWILTRYRLEGLYQGSAYWKLADRAKEPVAKPFSVQLLHENEVAVIRSKHQPAFGSMLRLTVTYRTERIGGPLGSAVDKLTRVTLCPSGVLDEQPFSWAPGAKDQVREVYLLPKPGADVEVRLSGEGPILSSRLVVVGAVAEEIQGVDIEGLVKTFQP